jgi:hypothetical protein
MRSLLTDNEKPSTKSLMKWLALQPSLHQFEIGDVISNTREAGQLPSPESARVRHCILPRWQPLSEDGTIRSEELHVSAREDAFGEFAEWEGIVAV